MNGKGLTFLFLQLVLSGWCTSAQMPDLPTPRGNQFAVELFSIKTPESFNQASLQKYSKSVDQLFMSEKNEVHAYPALYTRKGMTVENDQTEDMMLPESYNVVNGKPVPVNTLQHIGVRTRITINESARNSVSFQIDFHHQTIKGNDTYKLGNGMEVEIPYFEIRKVNTEVTQRLGSWVVLGGIEDVSGSFTTYYIIRITRP